MNLNDFLNYCIYCPCCNKKLNTQFHSNRKQQIKYYDDKFMVIFDLLPLKKSQKIYKVGYSLDFIDNSFVIDFFDNYNVQYYNESPIHLINRFKILNNNLKHYKIIRTCLNDKCKEYTYHSNLFKLDFKNQSIGDLSIEYELYIVEEDDMRYQLTNDFSSNKSYLMWSKYYDRTNKSKSLQTELISIDNRQQLIDKFTTYITFA